MSSFSSSLALLSMLQFAAAVPTMNGVSEYVPFLDKRQSPSGTVDMCKDNTCSDCPLYAGTGPGFPQCVTYPVAGNLDDFPTDQNGFKQVYVSVPPLDPGCRVIVRSPVFGTNCAGTDLVAQGATCAPLRLENNFSIFFCCGTGDCSAAGVPRSLGISSRNPFSVFSSFGSLALYDKDGNSLIQAQPLPAEDAPEEKAKRNAAVSTVDNVLTKRQGVYCSSWVAFGDPYTAAGAERPISDTVTCGSGGSQPCQIRADRGTTENWSVTGNVGVAGAFKIVSAGVSIQWQESNSRSFGETFGIDPGATGYIAFVPRLTCSDGQWVGPEGCPTGQQFTACGPSTGTLEGDIRLVQVRG